MGRVLLSCFVVVVTAACGSDAPIKVEAKGTILPTGAARIDVQTVAGAKVSVGLDASVTADGKGHAVLDIPAERMSERDVNVTAELGERYGSTTAAFAPALYAKANTFACRGEIKCSGSIDGTVLIAHAPTGTSIRFGGTEANVRTADDWRFAVDPIAFADQVGISAIAGKQPVTVPLDIKLPAGPELHAKLTVATDIFAWNLAQRLADIAKMPLPRAGAATTGALVVVQPKTPDKYSSDGWVIYPVGGVAHPSDAKLVIVGTPVRAGISCGKYQDVEKGNIIDLTYNVLDVHLEAFDAATGKPMGKTVAKASRKCPEHTKGTALLGIGGTEAKVDDAALLAAATKLAGGAGRAARTAH